MKRGEKFIVSSLLILVFVLLVSSVGFGYFSSTGQATKKNPNPNYGPDVSCGQLGYSMGFDSNFLFCNNLRTCPTNYPINLGKTYDCNSCCAAWSCGNLGTSRGYAERFLFCNQNSYCPSTNPINLGKTLDCNSCCAYYASNLPTCKEVGLSKGYTPEQLSCKQGIIGCSNVQSFLGKTRDCDSCCGNLPLQLAPDPEPLPRNF